MHETCQPAVGSGKLRWLEARQHLVKMRQEVIDVEWLVQNSVAALNQ